MSKEEFRSVTSLTFEGLVPAEVGPAPTVVWVDPKSLVIDDRYQRTLSRRSLYLIRKIIEHWDWAKFKPPICSYLPDGRLTVNEGQHTSISAASHPGIDLIPVLVTDSKTLKERAQSFLSHNRDRLGMTPMQLYHGAVAAGDPTAEGVKRACETVGIEILRSQPQTFKPNQTISVNALCAVYERVGEAGLIRVLNVLKPAGLEPIASVHLKAASTVLFDKEYTGSMDDTALAATIKSRGDALNEAALLAASHKIPQWKALTIIYFRHTRKKRAA